MGFFRTTTGRMIALSMAIAFIGGGASALMPHGVESSALLCASLFLPVVVNTAALPRALENDWYHAALAAMLLPLLYFLWAVGVGSVREYHPWIAYPSIAAGLAALAVAVRPSPSPEAAAPAERSAH